MSRRRRQRGRRPRERAPSPARSGWSWHTPQPIIRLEALRILVPLAILGFMATRIAHAGHWVGDAGFRVPDLGGGDWRQPLYLPALPGWTAWAFAATMVASGVSLAAGFLTRWSAGIFAATLVWVALADRLSAFTVTKLGAVLVVALALSPCGLRYGVDAWRRRRRDPSYRPPTHVSGPNMLFFQVLLVVMYCASGVCKARGHWLDTPNLLWTHLYDSYQTPVTRLLANTLPGWSWNVFQGTTLAFEALAPLWFGLRLTRPFAIGYGLAMHATIGLIFGPVVWFALLMSSLIVACYGPTRWLERTIGRLPDGAAPPPPEGEGASASGATSG